MKNIQVIDKAENCVYDIFTVTDEEFSMIFPASQDVAFIGDVCSRVDPPKLDQTLSMIWKRRVRKCEAQGIHGLLFYGLDRKKVYYPTRRDEEARNPDGSKLRA